MKKLSGLLGFVCLPFVLAACGPQASLSDEVGVDGEVAASIDKNTEALLGTFEAFQANTGNLWVNGVDKKYGMAKGTNPAVLNNNCYAFQANTGKLYVVYNGISKIVGPMAPRTSPSVSAENNGSDCIVAAQGVDNKLYTYDAKTQVLTNWNFGMAPETSPSIVSSSGRTFGSYVAFQANNGLLHLLDKNNRNQGQLNNLGLKMADKSSPSVASLIPGNSENSQYFIAFKGSTGTLWTVDQQVHDWGLGIAPGTNPSVTSTGTNNFWSIAFNAAVTNDLWTIVANRSLTTKHWSLGMAPGTSPVISGTIESKILFQSNGGELFRLNWKTGVAINTRLGMGAGTSPALN